MVVHQPFWTFLQFLGSQNNWWSEYTFRAKMYTLFRNEQRQRAAATEWEPNKKKDENVQP